MACRLCEESLTAILRTLMHFDLSVKVCTCHNGAPKAGVGCPASGAPKCASCNLGFTISHDGTQCIRTWWRSCALVFAKVPIAQMLNVQDTPAPARMAWRQLGPVVPPTVLLSARHVTLGLQLTTRRQSASVRVRMTRSASVFFRKLKMYIACWM